MASRQFWPLECISREVKVIAGSFLPAGAGQPTGVRGGGFTVTRSNTGTYQVDFADKYVEIIAMVDGMQRVSQADNFLLFGPKTEGGAATNQVFIRTMVAGAAADVAADPDNRVSFVVYFRNSSVPGP